MQFKDLVAKLDELIGTSPTGRPTAQQAIQASKTAQAGQATQADPNAQAAQTPPAEKPIPGQQPNLGPKPTMTSAPPQQVIGAQPQPAQQNQQANGGMAAAILQAVNQMKTQQPNVAPTTSQSIANQQQQAVAQAKGLQQTAKPGEPLEEVQVDEWGEWLPSWMGGGKKAPTKSAAKQQDLDDEGVDKWAKSLSSNPDNITHPNWKNISPATKQKIIGSLSKTDPNASAYIEAMRKYNDARKQETPNPEELEKLEKERTAARQKWNSSGTPAKNEPAQVDPVKPVPTQAQVQSLGQAYANAKDPVQKAQALKDYEAAAALAGSASTEPTVRHPIQKDAGKPAANKEPVATTGDGQTFSQAFAAARKEANGPDGRFTWTNPKTGKTITYTTAYKDEVKTDVTPNAAPSDNSQDSEDRKANIERMKQLAGATSNDVKTVDLTTTDNTVNPVVAPTQSSPNKTTTTPSTEPATVEPGKKTYEPIKTDGRGKTYLDPFNIGPSKADMAKQQPGDGAPIRVKEMSLQSLVDDLLAEDATLPMTQPKPSAWNKAKDIAIKANDTVNAAIPKSVKNAAAAVTNIPGVGKAARVGLGTMGALGAVSDVDDAIDRYNKGDYKGAAIRGVGAIGGVAQMAKHPVAIGLGLAAQQGADWYLDKTDAEKSGITKEDEALKELYDIIQLAGKSK